MYRISTLLIALLGSVAALGGDAYQNDFEKADVGKSAGDLEFLVIGGAGTLCGALYGSLLLTVLRSVIGSYTEHHLIIIGLMFMGAVIFLPRGLIGLARPALMRLLAGAK